MTAMVPAAVPVAQGQAGWTPPEAAAQGNIQINTHCLNNSKSVPNPWSDPQPAHKQPGCLKEEDAAVPRAASCLAGGESLKEGAGMSLTRS